SSSRTRTRRSSTRAAWTSSATRRPSSPRTAGSPDMLEVRELHKSFGKVHAVQGVSFVARDGEITGLLGPNGAGKTTTLRMLYTLTQPECGQVLVDGIDALADPLAARRQLGVLPDGRGLYKRLTARENMAYY